MTQTGADSQTQKQKQDAPPTVKPHPRLFVALCVIFALWMAVLVALYVLTVWPVRHP
ncbi:MAG TPA: hypothetical protein VL992_17785 [Tepidisphaeraceae bacterium]|jgi:hypothetical protein|nr:hypothetical protein [Tepidisphaeraceae bacterium]